MKIVVALDKFKGSLIAPAACEIVRCALLAAHPTAQIVVKPMADGGDGTADALHAALGGEWISQKVTGPLLTMSMTANRQLTNSAGPAVQPDQTQRLNVLVGRGVPTAPSVHGDQNGGLGTARPTAEDRSLVGRDRRARRESGITAKYLWLANERRAFVEMAQASGLVLLTPAQRNPLLTTTFGTGELLADAIRRGAERIWLAVGGSATTDGGIGAATALGWQFLDANGQPVSPVGGELERIVKIEAPPAVGRDRRARLGPDTNGRPGPAVAGSLPQIEVLCDVDNPLCGDHGAARVFGPQKGATPVMVERLDAGLRHLAALVQAQLGKEILNVPGAGAAGGLAGGAIAFLNARLVPGIETVMTASRLAEDLAGADWVITGEGQFDEQSLRGKVVAGVTALARQHGVHVAVLAGRVRLGEAEWRHAGIEIAQAIAPATMPTTEAMQRAPELLAAAVGRCRLF